jgi:hypothetical protein
VSPEKGEPPRVSSLVSLRDASTGDRVAGPSLLPEDPFPPGGGQRGACELTGRAPGGHEALSLRTRARWARGRGVARHGARVGKQESGGPGRAFGKDRHRHSRAQPDATMRGGSTGVGWPASGVPGCHENEGVSDMARSVGTGLLPAPGSQVEGRPRVGETCRPPETALTWHCSDPRRPSSGLRTRLRLLAPLARAS